MTPGTLVMLLGSMLVVAGVVGGIAALLRVRPQASGLEANPMVPRVTAEVHAGEEQVLICLARSLRVATNRADVGYGEIYLAGSVGSTLRLASRSEIGRGFDGEVRVHRGRRATIAEYYVLRLPGDDSLHSRIAQLDDDIAGAMRDLDPAARLQFTARPDRALIALPQQARLP